MASLSFCGYSDVYAAYQFLTKLEFKIILSMASLMQVGTANYAKLHKRVPSLSMCQPRLYHEARLS